MLKRIVLLVALFILGNASAFAAMTISGTRIIFPAADKEVNVRTNNKGDKPVLVQVWVDDGNTNANLNNTKVPFIVTPPVYRVEPGKGQSVRLIYNGMTLPQDRESVFWFNLLEIPPKSKDNNITQKLELAFRTRIKIFYRPAALSESGVLQQKDKLKWETVSDSTKGTGIKVINPTPYYFSFDSVSMISQQRNIELESDMVAPKSERIFYPKNKLSAGSSISGLNYGIINEYGAVLRNKMISSGKGFVASTK